MQHPTCNTGFHSTSRESGMGQNTSGLHITGGNTSMMHKNSRMKSEDRLKYT